MSKIQQPQMDLRHISTVTKAFLLVVAMTVCGHVYAQDMKEDAALAHGADWSKKTPAELLRMWRAISQGEDAATERSALLDYVWATYLVDAGASTELSINDIAGAGQQWVFVLSRDQRYTFASALQDRLVASDPMTTNLSSAVIRCLRFGAMAGERGKPSLLLPADWLNTWLNGQSTLSASEYRAIASVLQTITSMKQDSDLDSEHVQLLDHVIKRLLSERTWLARIEAPQLLQGLRPYLTQAQIGGLSDTLQAQFSASDNQALSKMMVRELVAALRCGEMLSIDVSRQAAWVSVWMQQHRPASLIADPGAIRDLLRTFGSDQADTIEVRNEVVKLLASCFGDVACDRQALSRLAMAVDTELTQKERPTIREAFEQNWQGAAALAEVEQGDLETLVRIGRHLGVSSDDRAAWLASWLLAAPREHDVTPETVGLWLQQLEGDAPRVIQARNTLIDRVLERMVSEPKFVVASVRSSLPDRLLPYLNASQQDRLRHALTHTFTADPMLLDTLAGAEFGSLALLGERLGVPNQIRAQWLQTRILQGAAYKKANALRVAWLLKWMHTDNGGVDFAEARRRLIDHVLAKARADQAWVNDMAQKGLADFSLEFHAALHLDEQFGDEQVCRDALASVLNAVDPWSLWSVGGERRIGHWQLHGTWYDAPRLVAGRTDHDALAAVLHQGLVVGVIEPRPTTLALLAWYDRSQGGLEVWKAYLDDRIASSEMGSEQRMQWLLGRAYAEELTGGLTTPLRGRRWIEQALAEAQTPGHRLGLTQVLFLQMAVAGQYEDAESLLASAKGQFEEHGKSQMFASMQQLLPRFHTDAVARSEREAAAVARQREAGEVALLRRRLAEYRQQGRSAADIASLERQLESVGSN